MVESLENRDAANPHRVRFFTDVFPGLEMLKLYQPKFLRGDISAGLILVALLVPQGIAYSQLAGLPPVHGLYATLVPLLAYAVFGPSRILVLGPDSAVAPIVAAAIIPIAGADVDQRIALAGLLAILVGVLCVAGGIAGFGFLTDLFSWPVRVGYLAGIAVTVIVSQIPVMLGVAVSGQGIIDDIRGLSRVIEDINWGSLALGAFALTVLLLLKSRAGRLPGALIIVGLGIAIYRLFDMQISTVGSIPSGLPRFVIPDPHAHDYGQLMLTALAISMIAFADTSVLSRSYAAKFGQVVDQNQELRALGAANLAAGFFQGFPLSSSSSRTPVAEAAGARTQLTGVIAAVGLAFVLLFGAGLFEDLPTTILAAIVIAAVLGLIDVAAFSKLWNVHRTDFALALTCFLAVAVLGVLEGVGVAIGLSILMFLWRAWHPYHAVLGRADGVKGYHDLTRYPQAREIPGLMLFRFDAPLFFANAGIFEQHLINAIQERGDPPRRVVVASEPITDLDSTAAEMLSRLSGELQGRDIELAFAEMKDPVKDRLRDFGLMEEVGHSKFYPTLGVAVRTYVRDSGVDWIDWEEAGEERSWYSGA